MSDEWDFAATARTAGPASPVDMVSEWFRKERGWVAENAKDAEDREIVFESFEFDWFHNVGGVVIFTGFVDGSIPRSLAIEIVMGIYEVLKTHGRPSSLEFFDKAGNQIIDLKDA